MELDRSLGPTKQTKMDKMIGEMMNNKNCSETTQEDFNRDWGMIWMDLARNRRKWSRRSAEGVLWLNMMMKLNYINTVFTTITFFVLIGNFLL